MKIAIIHGSNQGFFPRFYKSLKESIENAGGKARLFVPNSGQNKRVALPNQTIFGFRLNWHIHNALFRITGKQDIWSYFSTYDLIRKLKAFSPDVMHLHVVNQRHLNFPMLINYINKYKIHVVWTFHDCRAFTGGCPYFDEVCCVEWKNGCKNCKLKDGSGLYKVGDTEWQWTFYKKYITSIEQLQIVTPSKWLANFVGESFLKEKKCIVIYNGVDTAKFSAPSAFDARKVYGLYDEKIILGCAIKWVGRKGLKYFEDLASKLPSNYKIVLIGGIDDIDKKRVEECGILAIGRTKSISEMISWYQQASVFVNPTLSDNFPTTNIESLSAGTPVVTFKTGGSPEAIDKKTGVVVEQGDIDGLVRAIKEIVENADVFSSKCCRERSKLFSNDQYNKYVELYQSYETI